jgi:hypothetical protein
MAIDDKTKNEEQLIQLAREKQGFYKGQRGFYIGTTDRGDDTILLNPTFSSDMNRLLRAASFWIDELGHPNMELLDLASIQMHDIIAGPFENREVAHRILPYVIRTRYLGEL